MTEESSIVWSSKKFKPFKPMDLIQTYGQCSRVYICHECCTKFLKMENGHLFHILTPQFHSLIIDFYSTENILNYEDSLLLDKIGTPDGTKDYPASAKLSANHNPENVVIKVREYIWPVSIISQNFKLYSQVKDIKKSEHAMTLHQRKFAYGAPERRMGLSPIWLKGKTGVFMTDYGQFFIPPKYGKPEDFSIDDSIHQTSPLFEKVHYKTIYTFDKKLS